jgi:hypothetical protein
MPRRKKRKRIPDPVRFTLRVTACAVSVGRLGPDIYTLEPEGESRTYITLEGTLDRPVIRDLVAAHIQVSDGDEKPGNPGAAIGGASVWHVACSLPRAQFSDLMALVVCGRLAKVDMLFESLRRGSGVMRSVHFDTAPVPSEAEGGRGGSAVSGQAGPACGSAGSASGG